jgi:hypothetical protein
MIDSSSYTGLMLYSYLQGVLNHRSNQKGEQPSVQNRVPTASTSTPTSTPSRRSYYDGHSFRAFDLASLMGGREARSPKYPEKLLKVIDTTLQRIAMGQEVKWVPDILFPCIHLNSRRIGILNNDSGALQPYFGRPHGPTSHFKSLKRSPVRSRISFSPSSPLLQNP